MRCFCERGNYLVECGVVLGKDEHGWWIEIYRREDWVGPGSGLITRSLNDQQTLGENLSLARALFLFNEEKERLKNCATQERG